MKLLRDHGAILGLALFVLAASWLFVQPEPELQNKLEPQRIIPSDFRDWRGDDVDVSDVPIEEQLAPQAFLMRDYTRGDSAPVTLCLVYNYARRSRSFHDPQVCYPSQGYQLEDRGTQVLHLNGRTVNANVVEATRNSQGYLVVYWYLSGESAVDFSGSRQGDLKTAIMSRLKRTVGVSSMVRVSAPIYGSEELTRGQLVSFLQDFYPKILDVKADLVQNSMPATELWEAGLAGRALLAAMLIAPLALAAGCWSGSRRASETAAA
ncbi:MAG: EpsI family protein [Armatimonadetes bacterium]|nr:EpsI family protein [Armatimonadota bacterium]